MDNEARDELNEVVASLSDEVRVYVASLAEDRIIFLLHGLGTYVRNEVRAGRLRALFRWSQEHSDPEEKSLDGRTFPILEEIWKAVRDNGRHT